jgi:hypothetical protein
MQTTGMNIQMGEEKRSKVLAFISLFCCTKVGTKAMSPFFFSFNCDARYSFLLYALESSTVLLKQDHQCFSQSHAFIAVAMHNGRCGQIL